MKRILYDYPFLFIFLSLTAYGLYLRHNPLFIILFFIALLSLFRLRVFMLSIIFILLSLFIDLMYDCKKPPKDKKEFSGVIFKLKKSKMLSIYVKTDYGKMCIFAPNLYDNLYVGDKIIFETKIKPIKKLKNKNFKNYLSSVGVLYTGYAFRIKKLKNKTLLGRVQSVRQYIEKEFSYFLDEQEFVFIQSAILGNSTNRSVLKNIFINTQTAHLMVVSGMHMSFVFALFFIILYKIVSRIGYIYRRFNIKILASCLALVPVFFYFLISGVHIPAIRSFFMVLVFVIALMFGYTKNSYNALLFVASVFVVIFGYRILFNISFILSFFMSFIAIFLCLFIKNMGISNRLQSYLVFSVFMSIFAIPISMYYFHKISYVSIISNLFAIPYFGSLIMPLSFIAIIFAFLPYSYLKYLIFKILSLSVHFFLTVIKSFSNIDPYTVHISLQCVVLLYVALFLSLYVYRIISTSSK